MKHLIKYLITFSLTLTAVFAQSNTSFSGKVLDRSGAPIPNATVTVVNISTNTPVKVVTASDGTFTMSVPPGSYRMEIERAGFKQAAPQTFELGAAPSTINIKLQMAAVNESIEVRGQSPAVETEGADIGSALDTRTIRELPVPDRNHQQLVGLQSGVTPPVQALDTVRDPDRNRFFSTNGQHPGSNLYMTDGTANLEPFRGTAVRVQPTESVQQKTVVTSNYAEDRGYAGGAIVNDVTRAGTNGIHGSLFEFYSGNILRARDPFSLASTPSPRYVSNQFGGTLGGAIIPDRTFGFASYEGTYRRGSVTENTTVPTSNFANVPGLVLYNPQTRVPFTGNIIPQNLRNSTAAGIAALFPSPNAPGFSIIT